jgi:hypothetical protein
MPKIPVATATLHGRNPPAEAFHAMVAITGAIPQWNQMHQGLGV